MADATSQPGLAANPVINTANPITNGLIICAHPVTSALKNIVNGLNGTGVGTVPTPVVSLGLNGYQYSAGYFNFSGTGVNAATNAAGRTEVVLINVSNVASAYQSAMCIAQDTFWYVPRGGGPPNGGFSTYDTATSNISSGLTPTLPLNQVISVAIVGTNTNLTGYLNGVVGSSAALTSIYPANSTIGVGRGEGTEYNQNIIFLSLLWNRQLSAAELLSLANNPWQIFLAPSGDGSATGSLEAVALTTVSGSAAATTNSTATGSLEAVALTTVSGTASSVTNGAATGSIQLVNLTKVDGAATSTGSPNGSAVGSLQPIALTVVNAFAAGTGGQPAGHTMHGGWLPDQPKKKKKKKVEAVKPITIEKLAAIEEELAEVENKAKALRILQANALIEVVSQARLLRAVPEKPVKELKIFVKRPTSIRSFRTKRNR